MNSKNKKNLRKIVNKLKSLTSQIESISDEEKQAYINFPYNLIVTDRA